MLRGGATTGYTIVETMIFMAITTILFVVAVTTFSGRQESVQFAQSTRDAQSKIQNIINQVSSGFYPNSGNFTCIAGSGNSRPSFLNSPSQQGTSDDCVFLGKSLWFNTEFSTNTDIDVFGVDSIAARRTYTDPVSGIKNEVRSLNEAQPTVIPGVSESSPLQFGLSVTKVVVRGSTTEYGTIVFFSTLPKMQGNTGTLASGAQRVSFAAVPGSRLNDSASASASAVNGINNSLVINPVGGIIVCLADNPVWANAKRRATISVGEGASQTSAVLTTVLPGDTTPC